MSEFPAELHLQVFAVVLGDEFHPAAYGVLTEVDGAAEFGVKGEVGRVFAKKAVEGEGGKEGGSDAVVIERVETEGVEQ